MIPMHIDVKPTYPGFSHTDLYLGNPILTEDAWNKMLVEFMELQAAKQAESIHYYTPVLSTLDTLTDFCLDKVIPVVFVFSILIALLAFILIAVGWITGSCV